MLRKKGNFLFNIKENLNDGELIVSRRPKSIYNRKAVDYVACCNCKGFFSKKSLRIHIKKCTATKQPCNTRYMENSRRITGRLHRIASEVVRKKLFPPLRDDDVVRVIRYDALAIIYANKMVIKYKEERYFEMIRHRLRLIDRFLLAIRAINSEISDLKSVFDPKFSDDAHKALDKEASLNRETGSYDIPSVASSLGTLIKNIGNILIHEYMKQHNDEKRKHVKHFLKLFTQDINLYVNRTIMNLN